MLSKCLWKMFRCGDSFKSYLKRVKVDDVLDSLLDAIDSLPQRRDSRYDPIFEPHLKLVSVIHKFVKRGDLTVRTSSLPCVSISLLWFDSSCPIPAG